MIVLVNGLDSTKEHTYSSGHWAEFAARGVSCLMLDQPARRFGGYYAPRAAAFEKRFALVVARQPWLGAVQCRRLEREGERINVAFLIAHGAGNRQTPLEYAHRSYDQAVNSPKRELRIFTVEEGATEHIGLDHLPHASVFIADWVADTFADIGR